MAVDVTKRINDSIYGNISISAQELKVIDTPIFQRLRQIKQLGATDFVYPGATHTRFAHCIGTMHMMGQFISAAKKNRGGINTGDENVEKLRLAALLHDLGHYPYSHTVDKVVKRLGGKGHEEFGAHLLRKFFAEELDTFKPSEISDVFTGKSKSAGSLLISSALDADKADYLMRDSYHAGVPYGRVSIPRLIRTISYAENGIIFERDEIAVEDFLIGRYHMYRAVYHHKAVVAFNIMAERIFENLVIEGYLPNPKDLLNESDEYAVTRYTDSLFMVAMGSYLAKGKDAFLKKLIKFFLAREPLECVYINPEPLQKASASKAISSIAALEENESERAEFAESAGVMAEELFPATMRPLSLIDEKTKIYIKSKGKLKPITESGGLVLNMIGSRTLYDARLYAMPGAGKKVSKALDSYLKKR